jgi:hypothetical protein
MKEENWRERFEMCEMLAKSDFLTDVYKNKPQNIFIALQSAEHFNVSLLTVLQNTYTQHGKITASSSFLIALANNSNKLKRSIYYESKGEGEELSVTAFAEMKDSDKTVSFTVTMKQATEEGWSKRNLKYKTLPELMLSYRAAKFLINTHLPEVLFTAHASEELEDISSEQVLKVNAQQETVKKQEQTESVLAFKQKAIAQAREQEKQLQQNPALIDKCIDKAESEQKENLIEVIKNNLASNSLKKEVATSYLANQNVKKFSDLNTAQLADFLSTNSI